MELSLPLNHAGDPRAACDRSGPGSAGLDAVRVAVAYGYDPPTLMGYLAARTVRLKTGEPMSLRGPEGYVRDRIDASRAAGVTTLDVTPAGPEPARLTSTVETMLQGA